ncbi:MAG TPA: rhodanese-like domain-containing protein [Candidimonas sp.]|nr:rhodanese-like domain-containing protein [Candidimonas sp.]
MLKHFKIWAVAFAASTLTMVAAASAAQSGNLVSAQWLKDNLGNPDILLLDASPAKLYTQGHIPGAQSVSFKPEENTSQGVSLSYGGGVDYFTDTNAQVPFQELPPKEMEALFQKWGASPDRTVVVYDQGASMFATRLFYSFFYHGYPTDKLFILDGGLAKWQELGMPITQDVPPEPKKGSFQVKAVKDEYKASVSEVLTASGDPERNALVEGLGADWHFGEALNYDRRGHIPHAKMMPFVSFYNEDKTFKSPDELRKLLGLLDVQEDQNIYTHCGGGIAGSVPFFAIKFLAGYENVKHFPESQLGWLRDDRQLPFWTYDAPYLLRDSEWLQWWGGQRTRTLGSIHVSMIDVRKPDEYKEGHIPFALNIPASEFQKNLGNKSKLAALLGPAGVNPEHEAVVISDNGLSKDAALAFVALEALGQRKVSIFSEDMNAWANRGFPLKDTPTAVGKKKVRHDLIIPAVDYKAESRKGVFFDPKQAAKGDFPRVYIASGDAMPKNISKLDGKVVHVPYSTLVDELGKPKSAQDIWNTLHKAGVPRFAELIAVSDDAGEAAVNYTVLKLMGYPSISLHTL